MKLRTFILLFSIAIPSESLFGILPNIGLIRDCGLLYMGAMGSLIAHELGHALVAKRFWNSPIDITLGIQSDVSAKTEQPPLFAWKGIKLQTYNPFAGGFATLKNYPHDISDTTLYKKIATLAAGPLSGLAFVWLTYK